MTAPSAKDGPALLEIAGVSRRFGAHAAVDDVSLTLARGEFFCLLGPSGCGKSTLLRLIAGLDTPSSGRILLDGQDLAGRPPHRRPVNIMFQSYALFPHMSVEKNLSYGLQGLGLSRAEIARRVAGLLALVRLDGLGGRRPDTLSGGQRQRVALARALAREPKVLLLDEPLGALDRSLREETQGELRALQRRLGAGFVVVTHDPEEAMALADRIGVMEGGHLVQVGRPAELYERPASRFVAALLGDVNLIEGRLGPPEPGGTRGVETGFGRVLARAPEADPGEGGSVVVALRPERITLRDGTGEGIPGLLTETTFLGERIRRVVRLGDGTLLRASAPAMAEPGPAVGEAVRVTFDPTNAGILPA